MKNQVVANMLYRAVWILKFFLISVVEAKKDLDG
jgi:hypothetical protein